MGKCEYVRYGYCMHDGRHHGMKPIEVVHLSEELVVLDKPCSLPVSLPLLPPHQPPNMGKAVDITDADIMGYNKIATHMTTNYNSSKILKS